MTALLGAAPASAAGFAPTLIAPLGEELRGNDHGMDWQHCVQVVANLRAKQPEVPLVVLLGGSSARECTVLDDDWERQIERRSGYVVDAYNLGSKHRSYAQDLAFVKLLPADVPTIVYIGVNLGRFCLPVSSSVRSRCPAPRPAVPLPTARVLQQAHPELLHEALLRLVLARGPLPGVPRQLRSELGMLQKIIRACKRRHLRVALLDLPRDLPVIGSSFDGPVSRYHAGCASLARTWDVPWLHFNAAARFADRDFFDIFHLVEPGRAQVPEHPLGQDHPAAEEVPHAQAAADAVPVPSPSASPSPARRRRRRILSPTAPARPPEPAPPVSTLTLLGVALGLAMDAFAVAIGAGLQLCNVTKRQTFRLAWHFGLFQAFMPILGWLAGLTLVELHRAGRPLDRLRPARLHRRQDDLRGAQAPG